MLSISRLIQEQKLFNKLNKEDEECFDEPQLKGPHDGTGPGKGPGKGKGPNARIQVKSDNDIEVEKKPEFKGKIIVDKKE